MATAREVISNSLELIGVLASGQTMSSNDASVGLKRLNNMIKSWNTQGLLVHKITREEFTLTANQSSRTMGSGGNFSTTKPTRILKAGILENGTETPIDIYTADQWAEVGQKSLTSNNPSVIYPEGTHPLETINLWPVPTSTNKLVLYSEKPILSALVLSDSISLPDGYDDAIEYNLAVRLAPIFSREPSLLIIELARDLKAGLKRHNYKPKLMKSDAFGLASRRAYNINTGE